MSDIIEIDLDDPGPLMEPPIVDAIQYDKHRNAWIVTIIPEDRVSSREKEVVTVPSTTSDGQRIKLRMQRLATLLGFEIQRIAHAGGGNFIFIGTDGSRRELADASGSGDLSMRAYLELSDISMSAQIAFLAQNRIATL